jgi:hypothetical protein
VFLRYLGGTRRYIRFPLISTAKFYYVSKKLIFFYMSHTNLILVHHLKYLSIGNFLLLIIRSKQMNYSR